MSKSRVIVAVAEERANNWMAVDSAAKVSSDEFWGDDAGSGGMQLQDGIEKLIAAMMNEARYYKAISSSAALCKRSKRPESTLWS